jgi:hypothetical protein
MTSSYAFRAWSRCSRSVPSMLAGGMNSARPISDLNRLPWRADALSTASCAQSPTSTTKTVAPPARGMSKWSLTPSSRRFLCMAERSPCASKECRWAFAPALPFLKIRTDFLSPRCPFIAAATLRLS